MAEALSDEVLAEAGPADQQDVFALLYESAGCEVDDPEPGALRVEGDFEVGQGLDALEVGPAQVQLELFALAALDLVVEQALPALDFARPWVVPICLSVQLRRRSRSRSLRLVSDQFRRTRGDQVGPGLVAVQHGGFDRRVDDGVAGVEAGEKPIAMPRTARSTAPLSSSSARSSKKRVSAVHRCAR